MNTTPWKKRYIAISFAGVLSPLIAFGAIPECDGNPAMKCSEISSSAECNAYTCTFSGYSAGKICYWNGIQCCPEGAGYTCTATPCATEACTGKITSPGAGWTCADPCIPVTQGTTVTNGAYNCISGTPTCSNWTPPVTTPAWQTAPCTRCIAGNNNYNIALKVCQKKGKSVGVASICTPYTAGPSVNAGTTKYHQCIIPGQPIPTYECQ